VGSRTASAHADYYQLDATGIAAGSYDVYVRSHLQGGGVVESMHVPVTVVDVPPHGGPTMTLSSDLVLSGSTSFELIGTPGARALLTSSNGSKIRSAAGWTGHFIVRYADVIGLGSLDVPGIDVTVGGSGPLEVRGSVFDRCGPPAFTAGDSVPVTISDNTFQPNTLVTASDVQDYADSKPSVSLTGGTTTTSKVFRGNNVGVAYVQFLNTANWLVGGDHDVDGNVIIGVRGGVKFVNTSAMTLRGNIVYHRYPYGWSEGHNVNYEGSAAGELVEHNVIRGGSWMLQGITGEVRYNLMIDNNEAFFRFTDVGTPIHHNVLVDVGLRRTYYPTGGLVFPDGSFYNNTIDMGGTAVGWHYDSFTYSGGSTLTSIRNNVFTGFNFFNPVTVIASGSTQSADYNAWYNPDSVSYTRYASGSFGAHDIAGGASSDPHFSQLRAIPFPYGIGDLWLRRTTTSQLLGAYRARYLPAAGSSLIDAGSPSDDTGGIRNTDVGAVGAGNVHPDDKFGTFGP
jgi:hypothetical protein